MEKSSLHFSLLNIRFYSPKDKVLSILVHCFWLHRPPKKWTNVLLSNSIKLICRSRDRGACGEGFLSAHPPLVTSRRQCNKLKCPIAIKAEIALEEENYYSAY